MEEKIFKDFERRISSPRFRRYRAAASSRQEAVAFYLWNIALCESLYPAIHFFEVALRNATHGALSVLRGDGKRNNPRWFMDNSFLTERTHQDQRDKAITQVWKEKRNAIGDPADRDYPKEPYRIVAALSMGFWVNLYSAPYAASIVQKIAGDVFPNGPSLVAMNKRQGDVYPPLKDILGLRNRVFHQEPIYHWAYGTQQPERSLLAHQRRLCDVLAWMCAVQPVFLQEINRFQAIHDGGPQQFYDSVQIGFWQVAEASTDVT